MSRTFSVRLGDCRREKGITQKAAAEELGITPALLSHYEKGIRECKIDMVARFAEYYGVTTDWLLGFSESKHGAGEVFNMDFMGGDDEISEKTVIRSVIGLSQLADSKDLGDSDFFCDFFSLCIKKYIDTLRGNDSGRAKFSTQVLDGMSASGAKPGKANAEKPVCIETAIGNADNVIDNALVGMMGR